MNSTVANHSITINRINAFTDNYIWSIQEHNHMILVDPGDADVCIKYIEENQLVLAAILITHRHPDHVGGVSTLVEYCNQKNWPVTVYGPAKEALDVSNIKVTDNEKINHKGFSFTIQAIEIFGHTFGHIGYLINDNLFCGDTLFSGGCGRIFDGTAEQLFKSLNKIALLPEKTQVYCAHEYTLANLAFALTVDPTNDELISYYNLVQTRRNNGESSIPTSIHVEKRINPFLRCAHEEIKISVESFSNKKLTDELSVFTHLRKWKDEF
jgi:hydroxyacylglutathione hydrolase